VIDANPWLADHFPQISNGSAVWGVVEASVAERAGAAFFRFLDRHPRALALMEVGSRAAVIGVHRFVSLTRGATPAARDREAFVNLVKRPYSVYDVPGREGAIPAAAFRGR
jgi:hypothetical protein